MATKTKSAKKAAPKKSTPAKKAATKKSEKSAPAKKQTDPDFEVTGVTQEQITPTVDTEKLEQDKVKRLDEIGVPKSKRGENVHEHNVDLQGSITGKATAGEVHKQHLAEQTEGQTYGDAAKKSAAKNQ